MTRNETAILLGILKTAYPRLYADLGPADLEATVNLWADMFCDVALSVARMALQSYIATSPWPPTVADLRRAVSQVTWEALPDAGEAWGQVLAAIRNFGYMQPEAAYQSMSAATRQAVRRMGWANLCASQDHMADRAHFLKIYQSLREGEESTRLVPLPLRENIGRNLALHAGQPGQPGQPERAPALLREPAFEPQALEAPASVREILQAQPGQSTTKEAHP